MTTFLRRMSSPGVLALVTCCGLLPTGCGDAGPRRVPVFGTVTLNGQPLEVGGISFMPDTARNPALKDIPSAKIEKGSYTLYTAGNPGAPAGWYKVIFVANAPADPKAPYAPPKSLINRKYATAETTDLSVEVVPSPAAGAYDFKLTP
jgi:hypothetical protein